MPWRTVGRIHRAVYRVTGGRLGAKLAGIPMLLLTTVGRNSGEKRTLPLACIEDGDDLVVVASNGGSEKPPAWWLNLQARRQAEVQFGRETREVYARQAPPDERARLWPKLVEANRMWAGYERKTSREMPVVILSRR